MKLAPMEVNYYLENPVMDIDSEPANYAYRYWRGDNFSRSMTNWIHSGNITHYMWKKKDVAYKLNEQIWGSALTKETELCESMLNV